MIESKKSGIRRVSLSISGTVQGVFYRREAGREGTRLGLSGWVENKPDGTVFAVAEGPVSQVGEFIRWCRRGPAHARVENVVVTEENTDLNAPGIHENREFIVKY